MCIYNREIKIKAGGMVKYRKISYRKIIGNKSYQRDAKLIVTQPDPAHRSEKQFQRKPINLPA